MLGEAERARAEGRDYEPASALLERIRDEREAAGPTAGRGRKKTAPEKVPAKEKRADARWMKKQTKKPSGSSPILSEWERSTRGQYGDTTFLVSTRRHNPRVVRRGERVSHLRCLNSVSG